MNRKLTSVVLSSIVCVSIAIACFAFIPNANAEQSDNTIYIEDDKITLDPAKYDIKNGELKYEYVIKLASEAFKNKPKGCSFPSRIYGENDFQYQTGQLVKDIRAMDYLARVYPDEFELRTDLIYNDNALEIKYIAKILYTLENSKDITEDQIDYLKAYVKRRKGIITGTEYYNKYNSLVSADREKRINEAIYRMPGMAESYAKTVWGVELTPEQKALAEKLEAERLAKLEAEREAKALAWLKHMVMSEVGTNRELGLADTSGLKTQEELDMYDQLIASGEIISREQWELSVETDVEQ